MKYGLPREEKSKKKWKTAIENELRCLQMEVCFLKDQLDEATKKLAEFTSSKASDPFAFIRGFSRNENPLSQFSQNGTNNFSSTNKSVPPFATDFNGNNNQRSFTCSLQSSQGNPFASVGTERPHYQSTWDYDMMTRKAARFHSITCMPCYKDDKSFEELRYEDYVLKGIGFSNQIQRCKDSKLRSPRTEKNYFSFTSRNGKPFERKHSERFINHGTPFMIPWYLTPKLPKAPWPFGPSLKSNETSNAPASDNITSGASDVSIESNFEAEQNRSEPIFAFQSKSETKNYSDVRITTNDENLSSQVLMELRKMGKKISSINDRLSKMDSNLSDVSSRVSVMDSRLSAVDMFVTMQRFDKKWQGLETRLAGLETPSPAKAITLPVDESVSKETIHSLSKGTTLGESVMQEEKINNFSSCNEKNKSPQISEFGRSVTTTPKTSIKNEAELSAMDVLDMNLSDFVRSISCTDITMESKSLYTSSLSDHSAVRDSSSKIKLEIASIEMADLKSNSLPSECALIENSSPQENKSIISYSGSVPSVSANIDNISKERGNNGEETQVMSSEITGILKETKLVQKPELQINSYDKDNNNGKKSNDPLGVTEQKDSSSTKPDDLFMNETGNDVDIEFVIVEKSDVEESLEDNSKTKTLHSPIKHHLDEKSSDSEFKMYSDITEYLEINLGKKKNLVYEFGFEAKPDYLLESEGSSGYENKSVETQENKAGTPSRDDSFQQFKTNFIENKSVGAKQSSPFVFFDSKTPEESPGKNPFSKNC